MRNVVAILGALGIAAAGLAAAADEAGSGPRARTVTIVPGAHYQAGWFHELMLGAHWRDAWNTPLEVPVLDLDGFDGGLTPQREGGGGETFNLHFKSANGRNWVFRSVDKNPTRKMDPATAQGWIGALAQDLIAGSFPLAPLPVAPLLEAAGVLHATPRLVVMPDDPRVADYSKDFVGSLGTLEERIEKRIPGVNKTAESIALFARLERRNDERVDARDYLRARLVDILVGDWDRHEDQYRWVRFGEKGERVWRVVPRDRDVAFSRFDGALPSLIEYYGKPIVGWGTTYPPIDKITFAGRYTDRRFLVPLERAEWEAVTADVQARITDAVIAEAVHTLPPPLYAKTGAELGAALRSRRDLLVSASKEYYRLLAQQVDVRGTTEPDDFDVEREPGGAVVVSVYGRDRKSGDREQRPYFRRRFVPDETSEIRVYTMGGKDRVLVHGNGSRAITLRVVSPPGEAEIVDPASVAGVYEPLRAPAPAPSPNDPLLATANDQVQAAAPSEDADEAGAQRARYEVFRDWGRDYLFFPEFSYDSTRGAVLGGFVQRTGYGFQLDPMASQQKFGAVYSTGLNSGRVEYGGDFRTRSPVRGLLYVAWSGIEQARFFGYGNETARSSGVSSAFYDARQNEVVVNPLIELPLLGPLRARAGLLFKHVWSVNPSDGLAAQLRPEGANGMSLGSAEAGLSFGAGIGDYPSRRSIGAALTGRLTPSIFSNPETFGKVRGEVAGLYETHVVTNVQVSARVAGERNFGTYPFFEAAYLGGTPARSPLDLTGVFSGIYLRGYDLNRFAGDSAVALNTELHLEIGEYTAFLPLKYGVFGLYDVGRVFVGNDPSTASGSSSKWHQGVGGGVWLGLFANSLFFNLAGSMKAALVHSDEGLSFFISSGFGL